MVRGISAVIFSGTRAYRFLSDSFHQCPDNLECSGDHGHRSAVPGICAFLRPAAHDQGRIDIRSHSLASAAFVIAACFRKKGMVSDRAVFEQSDPDSQRDGDEPAFLGVALIEPLLSSFRDHVSFISDDHEYIG